MSQKHYSFFFSMKDSTSSSSITVIQCISTFIRKITIKKSVFIYFFVKLTIKFTIKGNSLVGQGCYLFYCWSNHFYCLIPSYFPQISFYEILKASSFSCCYFVNVLLLPKLCLHQSIMLQLIVLLLQLYLSFNSIPFL